MLTPDFLLFSPKKKIYDEISEYMYEFNIFILINFYLYETFIN